MFTIFIASLLLLAALLVVKMLELQSGKRLFLASVRDRADRAMLSGWRSVQSRWARISNHVGAVCRRRVNSWRYRFSDWLEHASRKLRE